MSQRENIAKESESMPFSHALLNDLQVLLGAVQLCKDDAAVLDALDRAIMRIEHAKQRLLAGGSSDDVR